MSVYSPSYIAGGDISPSRFVKIDTQASEPFQVLTAGTNGKIVGVSQEGTRYAPGVLGDDGLAAHDTEGLKVFGPGEVCLVVAGDTITQGDYLKSDNASKAVPVTLTETALTHIGGFALENGVAGEKIRIKVWPFVTKPA